MVFMSAIIGFAGLLVGAPSGSPVISLVTAGKPVACIVLPAQPDPQERYAGRQLQEYLRKISQAELPITEQLPEPGQPFISVGRTALVDIGAMMTEEEAEAGSFLLRTEGAGVVIVGGRPQGTLFGVYALLEELGCRFYAPGPAGEVIPRRADVLIGPLDRLEKPSFLIRCVRFYSGENFLTLEGRRDLADWRNKLRLGGPMDRYTEGYGFDFLLPAGRYYQEHPEWFALRYGKRHREGGLLCLSNAEMRREFARNVIAWFGEHPQKIGCTISPHDGAPLCDCEQCAALDDPCYPGDMTRRMIYFANEITEAVVKVFPDKYLQCYIPYNHMYHLPADIQPHPHFIAEYVDVRGNPNLTWDHPSRAQEKRSLNEWGRLGRRIMLHAWLHISPVDWPQARTLAQNLEFLHECGAFSCVWGTGGYSPCLKISMYAVARKMWDIKTDVPRLLQEYYADYYGPAGPAMKAYHQALEQAWIECHHEGGMGAHRAYVVFASERAQVYADHLQQAQAAVSDADVTLRQRVEEVWLAFQVGRDLGEAVAATLQATTTRAVADRQTAADALGRAMGYAQALERLDIIDMRQLTDFYYISFCDAVADPRPRTIPDLAAPLTKGPQAPAFIGPWYTYYYDTMHSGPQRARDAISMSGGLQVDFHEQTLRPHSEGEWVFEFAASKGKVFNQVHLTRLNLYAENLAASRAEISTDQGQTYRPLAEKISTDLYKDLTGELSGKSSFLMRLWGRNDSAAQVGFGNSPIIEWTETDAPAGTERLLLTTQYLQDTPEIPIDADKYRFDDLPRRSIPERVVLFAGFPDLGHWMRRDHDLTVENAPGDANQDCLVGTFSTADRWTEAVSTGAGPDAKGRTYTQLHLRPDQQYRLSFTAAVEKGTVRVGIEAAGRKTELLVLPETSAFQAYSGDFQTPSDARGAVLVTVEFTTDTDPACFRLAEVVIERTPKE